MVRRIVLKVLHALAVRVFATLEVLGIPRVGEEEGGEVEG